MIETAHQIVRITGISYNKYRRVQNGTFCTRVNGLIATMRMSGSEQSFEISEPTRIAGV